MTSHPETREVQGYDMVAAKGGLKLISARPECLERRRRRAGSHRPAEYDHAGSLAAMLTLKLEHPVADKTGATGELTK